VHFPAHVGRHLLHGFSGASGRWRGALVAVKVVAHDCSIASLAETLRESALSTSIQHPNVVSKRSVRAFSCADNRAAPL
jgi:hypothetical protein